MSHDIKSAAIEFRNRLNNFNFYDYANVEIASNAYTAIIAEAGREFNKIKDNATDYERTLWQSILEFSIVNLIFITSEDQYLQYVELATRKNREKEAKVMAELEELLSVLTGDVPPEKLN